MELFERGNQRSAAGLNKFSSKGFYDCDDNWNENPQKVLIVGFKAMDVTQVQSSIQAVNQLVALVVSRSTAMVQDLVAANAEIAAAAASQAQSAEVARSVEPGVGQQIDLLV